MYPKSFFDAQMLTDTIFVFGSNIAGRHGRGAARHAVVNCGAQYGVGEGLQGKAYAIPTKDGDLNTLPLPAIAGYVERFLVFARAHPELRFQVTRIGCGLAGLRDEQIYPLFAAAPANCLLPGVWEAKRSGVQRLLISGSRGFSDYGLLHSSVDDAIAGWGLVKPQVVSGGAKGADQLGERYADDNGLPLARFSAQWNVRGRNAGVERNNQLVWYSTHALVFWDGVSHDAQHLIQTAKEGRLRTQVAVFSLEAMKKKLGLSGSEIR